MKIILLFCFMLGHSFRFVPKTKQYSVLFCKDENNNINETNKVVVLPIDFSKLIEEYDNIAIEQLLGHLPSAPETEEEIEEDSFEGFLRNEFYSIATNKKINFETYYIWRKRAGIVLTKEEVESVYNSIIEKGNLCALMEFIKINKIIDEGNAGQF